MCNGGDVKYSFLSLSLRKYGICMDLHLEMNFRKCLEQRRSERNIMKIQSSLFILNPSKYLNFPKKKMLFETFLDFIYVSFLTELSSSMKHKQKIDHHKWEKCVVKVWITHTILFIFIFILISLTAKFLRIVTEFHLFRFSFSPSLVRFNKSQESAYPCCINVGSTGAAKWRLIFCFGKRQWIEKWILCASPYLHKTN